ncbi:MULTISPECIES: glycosyltransferase family 4 protein [unclassified Blastococcus]
MRVLVYPHDMELGGSSINAVDLAASVREHGHEPVLVARPGPLAERVASYGLPLVTVHVPVRPRPWPGAIRAIREVSSAYRVDLVHTYEFWPSVEGFLAVGGLGSTPVLGTIMTMGLDPYVPRSIPLTLGYGDLYDEAAARQRSPVHLVEPPVDTAADHPGIDTTELVLEHRLAPGVLTVVIVSRVAQHMKREGIERTVDAVERLGAELPVQLLVVGDGSALPELRARGAEVDRRLGRRAVVFTGALADPRPAYQVADVVVGMGSSALRAMAFAKPVVVVGVQGFSATVEPAAMPTFERTGFYGVGTGRVAPAEDPLAAQLGALLSDADRRRELGEYGRRVVLDRFSLPATAAKLDRIYRRVVDDRVGRVASTMDAVSTVGRVLGYKARDGGLVRRVLPRRT